jgi:hypothetical protein
MPSILVMILRPMGSLSDHFSQCLPLDLTRSVNIDVIVIFGVVT